MENKNSKKRKFLLLIPIALLPVIGLLLWSLISSQKRPDKNGQASQNAFNDKLPSANLSESGKNKLEIYMQAQKDSAKIKEQEEKDPYAKRLFDPAPPDAGLSNEVPFITHEKKTPVWRESPVDQNVKKVNDRLEKIYTALNNKSQTSGPVTGPGYDQPSKSPEEIEKMEKLLAGIQATDTSANPEVKQLGELLDKILDIQHPERVKERSSNQPTPQKDTALFSVSTRAAEVNFFHTENTDSENPFYGLQKAITADKTNTVLAVIHENQKIQDGQTLKFRLLQNIFVNNVMIPKGSFVFGKCNFSESRANVAIHDISYNNSVFPVELTVYDQTDGMEGINIQGDQTEEVSKDGVDQLIQQMQLNSVTSSLGVQAATSGIQTAKSLIGKKIKKMTVNLKADHRVLLKQRES